MLIETQRLRIGEFTLEMAERVHLLSLDADNRRFVPDEVFETVEEARVALEYLIGCYETLEGPLAYPVLQGESCIGYVQLVPMDGGAWEIGYHVGREYTGRGYATEAVSAFLPVIARRLGLTEVQGVCLAENEASVQVMLKCGFAPVFSGLGEYQGKTRAIRTFVWKMKE